MREGIKGQKVVPHVSESETKGGVPGGSRIPHHPKTSSIPLSSVARDGGLFE